MSKNTVKKGSFWSVLIVIVLVAAAVVLALVGSNKSATMKDVNTLTVSMNRYVYTNKLDVVEDECEKAFGDIKVAYEMKGDMSGDNCEIVYVVDADVDLSSVKETLKASLTAKTQTGAELEGAFIDVATGSEVVLAAAAKGTALRTVIALNVFAVLAFAYVAIRYNVGAGIVTAIVAEFGAALTAAVIVLTRIPITASFVYVCAVGMIVSVVFALLNLAKMKSVNSEDAEEVVSNGADKEINLFSVFAIAALLVIAIVAIIGAGVGSTVQWFAVMSIVAMVVAWFLANVYMPALYLPFVKKALANVDNGDYKGAVKTSTKEKKVYQKKVAPAPVKEEVEAPAEEVVEEAAEEVEAPAEEVVEEVAEEAEAPAEEVSED